MYAFKRKVVFKEVNEDFPLKKDEYSAVKGLHHHQQLKKTIKSQYEILQTLLRFSASLLRL